MAEWLFRLKSENNMAKKQRKKKNRASLKASLSSAELESQFHHNLEKFAYRPALKYAKELHQREPEKYRTLLIKALQGLYHKLNGKGQTARAETILEQARISWELRRQPETAQLAFLASLLNADYENADHWYKIAEA